MAKIAVELERAIARRKVDGDAGDLSRRLLAKSDGWSVADVTCTSGPGDRPFEEQHTDVAIVIVLAGSFQYRGQSRMGPTRELMTPGSLLLGNTGQCFECSHEHGTGDRCLSFAYTPEYFDQLVADTGVRGSAGKFHLLRLPPLRLLSPLVARACAGMAEEANAPWEELSLQLAGEALQLANSGSVRNTGEAPPSTVARVTRTIRMIEQNPDGDLGVGTLAQEARLSPYHFLRTFEQLTGTTPHQYVLRARLREAALRLSIDPGRILDIALDCGFGDVSNFNRAFRTEFGVSPRRFRLQNGKRESSTDKLRT